MSNRKRRRRKSNPVRGIFYGLGIVLFTSLAIYLAIVLINNNENTPSNNGLNVSIGSLEISPSPTITATIIPSPSSSPVPTPPPFEEYDISLMMIGDMLMHSGCNTPALVKDAAGKNVLDENGLPEYNYDFVFFPIKEFLEAADIKVVNQETILGGNNIEGGISSYPVFNSPTQLGDSIAKAGFNVVLHASNHATDKALLGLLNCVDFWRENHPEVTMLGIHTDAAEQNDITVLEIKDKKFAVLNYTYGNNGWRNSQQFLNPDYVGHLDMLTLYDSEGFIVNGGKTLDPKVLDDIKKAKELADIVIVFPHWGDEYSLTGNATQRDFARQMCDAGADLILGTHSHCLEPIEWITSSDESHKTLCYYSLGNYVSTQQRPMSMLEGMAWVTFHVTEDDIFISEKNTGILPLVNNYHYSSKYGTASITAPYLLEEYTDVLAAEHGIKSYQGTPNYVQAEPLCQTRLTLEYLTSTANSVVGEYILTKEEILNP